MDFSTLPQFFSHALHSSVGSVLQNSNIFLPLPSSSREGEKKQATWVCEKEKASRKEFPNTRHTHTHTHKMVWWLLAWVCLTLAIQQASGAPCTSGSPTTNVTLSTSCEFSGSTTFSFYRLTIASGVVVTMLTNEACSSIPRLDIRDTLIVGSGAFISANNMIVGGVQAGVTNAQGSSGGSHGGRGGRGFQAPSPVPYDGVLSPAQCGSGGGGASGAGFGGGVVIINAINGIQLDGEITALGGNATGVGAGGGSGGTIVIRVDNGTISGSGKIRANGGRGYAYLGGGGGGGRVTVSVGNTAGMIPNSRIESHGGASGLFLFCFF